MGTLDTAVIGHMATTVVITARALLFTSGRITTGITAIARGAHGITITATGGKSRRDELI